jgi:hypothetical protein
MQRNHVLLVLALALSIPTAAHADRFNAKSRFGLGLEVGAPSGLNMKYFLGGMVAIQAGVGVVESWGYEGTHVHAEAVWHPIVLARTPSVEIPLHVGVGARFLDHDDDYMDRCWNGRFYEPCYGDDAHLGVRAPFGISFLFRKVPMDVFLELALVFDLVHFEGRYDYDHDHAALHGALGARFYF